MDEKYAQLWTKISVALKPQVSVDTFKRWFSAVKLTNATADEVTLLVPNNIYQFWIESNHMPALQSAIVTAFGAPRTVKFAMPSDSTGTVAEAESAPIEISEPEPEPARDSKHSGSALGLNPRNTF